jgi:murein DD-endopeptidase MepM/ murein hydrolase activator NlpD
MRSTSLLRTTVHGARGRLVLLAFALAGLLSVASIAGAEPLDLDEAQQQRDEAAQRQQELQSELNTLLSRIEALRVAREQQTAEIELLDERLHTERRTARQARTQVAERYKQAYKSGSGGDPLLVMFNGDSLEDLTERARLLTLLAEDSREQQQAAEGASLTTAALSSQLQSATDELQARTDELAATKREAREKVAEAQAAVDELDQQIADEKERRAEERRRAEQRAAAREQREQDDTEATAAGSGGGGASAPVGGGIACPVGQPRNYTDTYGAPRSGGRSHLGVDILAPMGTPSYAYESGTITRMDGNSLGGISLYLRGDSGNVYYYTHLSGYRSGVSVGQQVSAGQHVAYVGDTGNAAGIPHLHFEVQPGGSGNVNPYPYAYRACG